MDNDYILEQKEGKKKSPSGPENMAGNMERVWTYICRVEGKS